VRYAQEYLAFLNVGFRIGWDELPADVLLAVTVLVAERDRLRQEESQQNYALPPDSLPR
jgi:hypothetical protein